MNDYSLTSTAERDLASIADFVARQDLIAAEKLLGRIYERFELLAGNPFLGEMREDLAEHLRQFTVAKYVIFYKPDGDGVRIMRVIHGHRDIPTVFRDGT
jgi:toxin ParE1/3/4